MSENTTAASESELPGEPMDVEALRGEIKEEKKETRRDFVGRRVVELMNAGIEGLDFGKAMEIAEKEWKENPNRATRKVGARNAPGSRDELFDLLRAGRVSAERYDEWLKAATANVRKNASFFDKIVALANGIRDDYEAKDEDEVEDEVEDETKDEDEAEDA